MDKMTLGSILSQYQFYRNILDYTVQAKQQLSLRAYQQEGDYSNISKKTIYFKMASDSLILS